MGVPRKFFLELQMLIGEFWRILDIKSPPQVRWKICVKARYLGPKIERFKRRFSFKRRHNLPPSLRRGCGVRGCNPRKSFGFLHCYVGDKVSLVHFRWNYMFLLVMGFLSWKSSQSSNFCNNLAELAERLNWCCWFLIWTLGYPHNSQFPSAYAPPPRYKVGLPIRPIDIYTLHQYCICIS